MFPPYSLSFSPPHYDTKSHIAVIVIFYRGLTRFFFFLNYFQFYPSRKALVIKTHAFTIIINLNSFFTNPNINRQQRENYLNEQFTYSLLGIFPFFSLFSFSLLVFSFLFFLLFLQHVAVFPLFFLFFFLFFVVGLFLFLLFRWNLSLTFSLSLARDICGIKGSLARFLSAVFCLLFFLSGRSCDRLGSKSRMWRETGIRHQINTCCIVTTNYTRIRAETYPTQ